MAVEPWELAPEHELRSRPRLELVPAPPRGGRVVPAILFVALVIGAIGFPTFRAIAEGPPEAIDWAPRPLPLSQLASLDPVSPIIGGGRPTSGEPAGGLLFVRCTNLWVARSDGSDARKLLTFSGASSPTFSPDARTIAFVGPTDEGRGLFLVGADGSGLTEVGSFTSSDHPIEAQITNLTWSPGSDRLAFALVDPAYDPLVGGSTIWMLDLTTGAFDKLASGWPSPAFIENHVVFARWDTDEAGASFWVRRSGWRSMTRRLSSAGTDYTFATAPDRFSDAWSTDHGTVVLREGGSGPVLAAKRNYWSRGVKETYAAPAPYRFFTRGRLGLSQDASYVAADLLDRTGGRALGILDFSSGDWTVLDYAWSGAASPAPTAAKSVGAERAKRLAGDVLGSWRTKGPYSAAAIMAGDDRDHDLVATRRGSYVVGAPQRTSSGWTVPATVYGRSNGTYSFRHLEVVLDETDDERVEAGVVPISASHPLRTIEDAKAFVAQIMGDELAFVWPTHLPAGTELNLKWPVDAYSWDGRTTATIHMLLPKVDGAKYDRSLNVAYGDVSFSLGCGGEMDPHEGEINGQPALFDRMGDGDFATRQVLWPGTLDARDIGTYSVYGELPEAELTAIAESMGG